MKKDGLLAVILGGGKGTRLYPLTKYRAKPAVPFGGKFRIIDVAISNCLNSHINRIFVLTQFNSHSLHRHIYGTYRLGHFYGGFVDILAAQQTLEHTEWYQGTADAVRQNLSYIIEGNTKYTIILSGDHLYRMDYREFLNTHIQSGADFTISVKPVSPQDAGDFGILQTDKDNHILRFAEKPKGDTLESFRSPGLPPETPFLASMGIYIFNTDILLKILEENPSDDFGRHIIPTSIGNYRVQAHLFDGYWKDIGTMDSFFQANLEMASPNPPFDLYDEDAPIYTHARALPGSRVENCKLYCTLIGEGSILRDSEIRQTVIGIRTRISSGNLIENCVIMGADYYRFDSSGAEPPIGIGQKCIIRNAIIDKNARIGNNVRIINENNVREAEFPTYSIRDGIVVIPKNSIIPDDTVI
ncbi:MAG: glucose-1-phosphate adenylyltransferase [Candidatus Marinimicrobia bacterium]|nr:glucose-1-phosphate adenylyltransferase [Candidatus Neomarinimicrobiota bacterium]